MTNMPPPIQPPYAFAALVHSIALFRRREQARHCGGGVRNSAGRGFGVHKFILGYTGTGLVMLLVSAAGTCGNCLCRDAHHWVDRGNSLSDQIQRSFYHEYILQSARGFDARTEYSDIEVPPPGFW